MSQESGLQLSTNKYEFSWEVLDVIISGRSSIDSPTGFQIQNCRRSEPLHRELRLRSRRSDREAAEILGNYHEALNFVRKYFLQPENPEGLKLEIPRKILELTDVRDLLLMASWQASRVRAPIRRDRCCKHWACSLLKVMHTIAHIDKDLRSPHFSDIQKQIFDRFYKFIHRDERRKSLPRGRRRRSEARGSRRLRDEAQEGARLDHSQASAQARERGRRHLRPRRHALRHEDAARMRSRS